MKSSSAWVCCTHWPRGHKSQLHAHVHVLNTCTCTPSCRFDAAADEDLKVFDELAGNEQQQEQEMGEEDDLMMVDEGRVTKNEKCPYTLVPVSAGGCQGGTVWAVLGRTLTRALAGACWAGEGSAAVGCVHPRLYSPPPSPHPPIPFSKPRSPRHTANSTMGHLVAHTRVLLLLLSTPCPWCCCCHPCRLRSSAIQWRTRWGSFTSEQPS